MPHNPFETLGLTPDATEAAVDRAYDRLEKKHHPRLGGDPARWAKIEAAHDEASQQCRRRNQRGVKNGISARSPAEEKPRSLS